MPRAKRIEVSETENTETEAAAPAAARSAPEPEPDRVEFSVLDELSASGDGEIMIERCQSGADDGGFLESISAHGHDIASLLTYIKRAHGGGQYWLKPRQGGRYVPGSTRVRIEGTKRADDARAVEPRAEPARNALSLEPPAWLQPILGPLLLKVADGLLNRPAPPAPAGGLQFSDALAMAKMFQRQEQSDPVEHMTKLLAFQREMRAEVEPKGAGETFQNLAASLAQMVSAATAARSVPVPGPGPGAVRKVTPQPAPPPAPQVAPQVEEKSEQEKIEELIVLVAKLASEDASAAGVAKALKESLSADDLRELLPLLSDPATVAMLPAMFPPLADCGDWLKKIAPDLPGHLVQSL